MALEIEWSDDFNIGVEIVDSAHRKLFSIVRRILRLTEDEANNRWACVEGIKYFKSYAMEHFQQEEAYMRSIGYPGYGVHRQLHDDLRDNILPVLERRLEKEDYSMEAVEQFVGVCLGWLTGHILVEDRAITGKAASKWSREHNASTAEALKEALTAAMGEVFWQKARVFSDHYGGEHLDRAMLYRMTYAGPEGEHVGILVSVEEALARSSVERMLRVTLRRAGQTMSASVAVTLQQFLRSAASCMGRAGAYRLTEHERVSPAAMGAFFRDRYPAYSILLDTDLGRLAVCIKPAEQADSGCQKS